MKDLNSFKHGGSTFKHGDSVTCRIQLRPVEDAKIAQYEGRFYVVQNKSNGKEIPAAYRFGYAYSWVIDDKYTGEVNIYDQGVSSLYLTGSKKENDYEVY